MFKRKRIELPPVKIAEYREPNRFDVEWHYRAALYWLRVAEQPGRDVASTAAAAGLANANATMGVLAQAIIDRPSEARRGRLA